MVSKILKGFIRKLKQCFFHKNGLYNQYDTYESLMVHDDEFTMYLKNFGKEIKNRPKKQIFIGAEGIYPKILYIFKTYIDATDTRMEVVEKHLKFLHNVDIPTLLMQCIICYWVSLLNDQNTLMSFAVKQHIVEYCMLGRGEIYR